MRYLSCEDELEVTLELAELPKPEREYRFHDTRRWRFDFAWPDRKIAAEVEGGTWMRTRGGRSGGHAHPQRFEHDCEKYNEAELLGWHVFKFTTAMVWDGRALDTLKQALVEEGGA